MRSRGRRWRGPAAPGGRCRTQRTGRAAAASARRRDGRGGLRHTRGWTSRFQTAYVAGNCRASSRARVGAEAPRAWTAPKSRAPSRQMTASPSSTVPTGSSSPAAARSGQFAVMTRPVRDCSVTDPSPRSSTMRCPSNLGYALLSCPGIVSRATSITGWRVHFTRREHPWPREATTLMREFSTLFAELDQGLDELGVPEGQPFLISPKGEYDVELNRYFSVWLANSPWSTHAAHARDLRTFFDFLWFARGELSWRGSTADDRAAYDWWRRRDERVRGWKTAPGIGRSRRSTSSTCGPSSRASCGRTRRPARHPPQDSRTLGHARRRELVRIRVVADVTGPSYGAAHPAGAYCAGPSPNTSAPHVTGSSSRRCRGHHLSRHRGLRADAGGPQLSESAHQARGLSQYLYHQALPDVQNACQPG